MKTPSERSGRLLTWERREPSSDVLVVTNMWPDAERPVYGIFIKRQVDSLIAAGVRCDVLYVRGYRSPLAYAWAAAWFALHSLSLRRRYRLVHAHAGETAVVARFAVGSRMLISYCGDDLLGDPSAEGGMTRASRIRAWVIRNHSRLFAGTVTKSAEMGEALPRRVREANTVLPNGVDRSTFHPRPRDEARAEVGWDPGAHIALFGATRPWIPRKRLWLAEGACERAAQELGREVNLEVVADVPPERMPLLMNAADCLLLTSSIEGSPNTVKEALLSGLPVIATPAGDVELLLSGVSPSWLCDADEAELGAAVAECLGAGRRSDGPTTAAWLSDDLIAARLIELYKRLAPIELAPSAGDTAPSEPVLSA